jgi:hypothetical protein
MESAEADGSQSPHDPKYPGRKKIKIQRIPDDRNRQVRVQRRVCGRCQELGFKVVSHFIWHFALGNVHRFAKVGDVFEAEEWSS